MPTRQRRKSVSLLNPANWLIVILLLTGLSVWQWYEHGEISWHRQVMGEVTSLLQRAESFRAGLSRPAGQADMPAQVDISGRIQRIIDGDGVVLALPEAELTVRLFGVDAPEHGQPYGSQATRALSRLVDGRRVGVVIRDVDSYGRLVGTLYLGERNINLEMVEAGHAWWYDYYAEDERALRDAQSRARAEGAGLWGRADAVPPWEWRRRH